MINNLVNFFSMPVRSSIAQRASRKSSIDQPLLGEDFLRRVRVTEAKLREYLELQKSDPDNRSLAKIIEKLEKRMQQASEYKDLVFSTFRANVDSFRQTINGYSTMDA